MPSLPARLALSLQSTSHVLISRSCSSAAVPNLFGTMSSFMEDNFSTECARQGQGRGGEGGRGGAGPGGNASNGSDGSRR